MSVLSNFQDLVQKRLLEQEQAAISSLKSMSERDCSFHAGYIAACKSINQDLEELLKDVGSW